MAKLLSQRVVFSIFLFFMSGIETMAEKKFCLKGQPCRLSLEMKKKTSFTDAELVVLGSFQPSIDDSALEFFVDDESLMPVAFSVDKIYKGEIPVGVIKLKIPIYTVPSKRSSKSAGDKRRSIGLLSQDFDYLERQLEEGRIDESEYEDGMRNTRMQILESDDYSRDKMVIVPIRLGGLDNTQRFANIPVEFGKKYILFVFKGISKQSATALRSWDLDLYPDAPLHVIEKALQTDEK